MPTGNQGVRTNGVRAGVAVVACLVLAVLAVAAWVSRPTGSVTVQPAGHFLDADPRGRAAYCAQASEAELIALASDVDWRVRSAAFEVLNEKGVIQRVPIRDTPMAEREQILLHWVDQHRPELSAELCSVFAPTEQARYGAVLVDRCLTCHAGRQPEPAMHDNACVTCHDQIHSDWSGTAHANSLSHLVLPTVDAVTRQPATYDFADHKGLSCVACHEPSKVNERAGQDACLTSFTPTSCATCHTKTQAQWEAWKHTPRYRPADWPPGSVEQVTNTQPRSCVDCHMPDGQHLWGARRDLAFLRSGVSMKVQEQGGGEATLVIQNLAGHAYPSGGVWRSLQLYIQTDDGPEELVAVMATQLEYETTPDLWQPELQPGEARRYPLTANAHNIRARLVYVRNRFDPDSYQVEIDALIHQRPALGQLRGY